MTTSARPERYARGGSVARTAGLDGDEPRHVKRPGQVLSRRKVDRRLAAERAVGGREKRRRHLDDRHPAERERRREPGHVAHRPAPERDDPAVPFQAARRQLGEQAPEDVPRLGRLAVGDEEGLAIEPLDASGEKLSRRGARRPSSKRRGTSGPARCRGGATRERERRPLPRPRPSGRHPPRTRSRTAAPGAATSLLFSFSENPRSSLPQLLTGFASAMPSSESCAGSTGPGEPVMRQVPGGRLRERDHVADRRCSPVRIISIRSSPSAMPPCGGAPKRNASRRKPNFARASSGPIPSRAKTRDWTSGRWIRIDPPPELHPVQDDVVRPRPDASRVGVEEAAGPPRAAR